MKPGEVQLVDKAVQSSEVERSPEICEVLSNRLATQAFSSLQEVTCSHGRIVQKPPFQQVLHAQVRILELRKKSFCITSMTHFNTTYLIEKVETDPILPPPEDVFFHQAGAGLILLLVLPRLAMHLQLFLVLQVLPGLLLLLFLDRFLVRSLNSHHLLHFRTSSILINDMVNVGSGIPLDQILSE